MSWRSEHRKSEEAASEAELALRQNDRARAEQLYGQAAEAEERALAAVEPGKPRTYGITAVSAVSLYWKAGRNKEARQLGRQCLASGRLPGFAVRAIEATLGEIEG